MRCRRYIKEKDYEQVVLFSKLRGVDPPPKSWLPKRGYIVDNLAVVFLASWDCKVGELDFFLTNPEANKNFVKEACDLGMAMALADAEKIGKHVVVAATSKDVVLGRLLGYGFVGSPEPFWTVRKYLKENPYGASGGRNSTESINRRESNTNITSA